MSSRPRFGVPGATWHRWAGRSSKAISSPRCPTSLRGRIDILLANVPYVPTDEIRLLPAEARLHEPLVTLDGGGDGLDILRRVSAEAFAWLAPGGNVLVETSEEQAAVAAAILAGDGLTARIETSEELYATVVIGMKE